jgi:hypothetical protein
VVAGRRPGARRHSRHRLSDLKPVKSENCWIIRSPLKNPRFRRLRGAWRRSASIR